MTNKLSKHKLVCCVWADAHMSMDEFTPSEVAQDFHKPEMVKTFGLLVHDNEIGVTLAMEEGLDDGKFRHLMFVPRQMVSEVIDLGVPKVGRKKRMKGGKAADTDVLGNTSSVVCLDQIEVTTTPTV